ncbi:hypothetical protein CPB86DRAFT_77471 [Serendipita vermifera]|nr:hypothetical protein CPB86DRAFT_77471 [Serendipita vermifera]
MSWYRKGVRLSAEQHIRVQTSRTYKLVVFGELCTGKLMLAILELEFEKQCKIDEEDASLDILVYATQDPYATLTPKLANLGDGYLLTYSITSQESFEKLDVWLGRCATWNAKDKSRLLGRAFADELNIPHIETSAKTGKNAEVAFINLVKLIKEHEKRDQVALPKQLPVFSDTQGAESSCGCVVI